MSAPDATGDASSAVGASGCLMSGNARASSRGKHQSRDARCAAQYPSSHARDLVVDPEKDADVVGRHPDADAVKVNATPNAKPTSIPRNTCDLAGCETPRDAERRAGSGCA